MIGKWFDMWFADKQSMIETMRRNMVADLEAGYNPQGRSILKQAYELAEYEHSFDVQMDLFKNMEDDKANRWCYLDLKKRGVS